MKTMKFILAFFLFAGIAVSAQAEINIIPRPVSVVPGNGSFTLTEKTAIVSGEGTRPEANYLADILANAFGEKPDIKTKGEGIELKLNVAMKDSLDAEGYLLTVESKRIVIEAATRAGIFYGIQSLRQLLPPAFEFHPDKGKTAAVPVVAIADKPRFAWRGFMLDVSRHFKGVDVVKSMLDQMALMKMNVFHWHLTDDQGWRIEIKKYPKLTSVGGYRKDTQAARHSDKREGKPHGGFYTQEQIKDIVAYAAARHINIVPEIEMPGHASAAIAAYPWLGVLGTTKEVPVTFGKLPDSFNIADPRVIQFLEDVLTEVFQLFPGKVVHIGGDEVMYDAWKKSKAMQAFMKKEGLTSPADLQIWFTNRISQFVDSTGHRMMGWNEILGDNVHEWQDSADTQVKQTLAKSAIIEFWKGSLDLINKAVSNGYDVVNAYHRMTYLDYNYKMIPLSKAYSFNPIPEGLDPKYDSKILGLGCQMWSEWIPTTKSMDLKVFPRLAAYAEVGWTPLADKNYQRFLDALHNMEQRWQLEGIDYHKGEE